MCLGTIGQVTGVDAAGQRSGLGQGMGTSLP